MGTGASTESSSENRTRKLVLSHEGTRTTITHSPKLLELQYGHVCHHSTAFGERRAGCTKGYFYHPKYKVAMTAEHPATIAKGRETKFYCVGSGPEKDKVYFIDQHKNS